MSFLKATSIMGTWTGRAALSVFGGTGCSTLSEFGGTGCGECIAAWGARTSWGLQQVLELVLELGYALRRETLGQDIV